MILVQFFGESLWFVETGVRERSVEHSLTFDGLGDA